MNLQDATVMKFLDSCDAAGIRNPAEFIKSKMPVVYDWLKGAFPRGILPTDIDGEVELNWRFLRFEFKHESRIRNGAIPQGQLILFKRLIASGMHTVFIIGVDDDCCPSCLQVYHKGVSPEIIEMNKQQLFEKCATWARWAEKQAPPEYAK